MATSVKVGERRTKRIPIQLPVSIAVGDGGGTRLNAEVFSVNAHGCGIRCVRRIEVGQRVSLHLPAAVAMARIVGCVAHEGEWLIGAELDQPANIWGIKDPPADWAPAIDAAKNRSEAPSAAQPQTPAAQFAVAPIQPANGSSQPVDELQVKKLSDAVLAACTSSFEQSVYPFVQRIRSDLQTTATETRDRLRSEIEADVRNSLEKSTESLRSLLNEVRQQAANISADRQEIATARAAAATMLERLQVQAAPALAAVSPEVVAEIRDRIRKEVEQELRASLASLMQPMHEVVKEVRERAAKMAVDSQEIAEIRADIAGAVTRMQAEATSARAAMDASAAAVIQRIDGMRHGIGAEAGALEAAAKARIEAAAAAAVQHVSSDTVQQIRTATENALGGFRTQLRATVEQEMANFAAELQAKSGELVAARYKQAMELLAQAAAGLQRDAGSTLQKLQESAEGLLTRAEAQLRPLENQIAAAEAQAKLTAGELSVHVEQAAGAFQARLARETNKLVQETTAAAHLRLNEAVTAICDASTAELMSKVESAAGPVVAEAELRLRETADQVAKERNELQRLSSESVEQARKVFAEALALAKGELRGRIDGSLEGAQASLAATSEQMKEDVQELSAVLQEKLQASAQQAIEQAENVKRSLNTSVDEQVKARLAAILDPVLHEVERQAQEYAKQWQVAVSATLEKLPLTLRDNLDSHTESSFKQILRTLYSRIA